MLHVLTSFLRNIDLLGKWAIKGKSDSDVYPPTRSCARLACSPQALILLKPYSYHHFSELSRKKSRKVPSKNFRVIFWKFNFFTFSKIHLKTNIISQLYVILTFIWGRDHNFQANICCDMKFPNYHSKMFWRNFPKNEDRNRALRRLL